MGPSLRAYNHFSLQYPLSPTFPASWRQGWEIQTGSSGIGKWNNVKKRSENRLWGVGIDVGECFHEAEEADAGKVLHKAEGQTQKDISGRCSRRKTILGVSFHAFKNFPQRTFKMSMPRFLLRWGCCDPQVTFFQLSGLMDQISTVCQSKWWPVPYSFSCDNPNICRIDFSDIRPRAPATLTLGVFPREALCVLLGQAGVPCFFFHGLSTSSHVLSPWDSRGGKWDWRHTLWDAYPLKSSVVCLWSSVPLCFRSPLLFVRFRLLCAFILGSKVLVLVSHCCVHEKIGKRLLWPKK